MRSKKHHIKLDREEREQLQEIAGKRNAAAVRVQRAKALLAMDCSGGARAMTDREVSILSGLSIPSLERLRKRVCEVGPLGASERKPRETPPIRAPVFEKNGPFRSHSGQ